MIIEKKDASYGQLHLLELKEPVAQGGGPLEVPPLCRLVDVFPELLHHPRQLLGVHALFFKLIHVDRIVVLLVYGREKIDDLFLDALGRYGMNLVVGRLDRAPPLGLVDRPLHGVGDPVGEHYHPAVQVPGCPAARLDKGGLGPQEALFVSVEYGHKGDFGKVETFPQQVHPYEDIELAEAKIAHDGDPFQGIDL